LAKRISDGHTVAVVQRKSGGSLREPPLLAAKEAEFGLFKRRQRCVELEGRYEAIAAHVGAATK
jgi:hypothetical protein